MIDLITYALLRKQIATAASGISDVRAEGDELVFVLVDGHEVRMAIPATEIRDAVVRDDVLVLTLEDDKEVVVDATLTQSGQAADAKVTGDAVNQLKDDISATAKISGKIVEDYYVLRNLTSSYAQIADKKLDGTGNAVSATGYKIDKLNNGVKAGRYVIAESADGNPFTYQFSSVNYGVDVGHLVGTPVVDTTKSCFVIPSDAVIIAVSYSGDVAPVFRYIAGAKIDIKLDSKLDINQGTENVGKSLIVGTDGNIALSEYDYYHGKKSVYLGDSITQGMSPEYTTGHTTCGSIHNNGDKIYWEIASELLGMSCIGYGVTGTTIKGNTGTIGAPFVDRYTDMDDDADVVCVFGGTNDFGLSSSLGTINDEPDKNATFYSALKYLLIGLYAKYPNARLIFCTPTPRFEIASVASSTDLSKARKHELTKTTDTGLWYYYDWEKQDWVEDTAYNDAIASGEDVGNYDHSYLAQRLKNNKGTSFAEYVDAIRSVCALYSVPVCDFNAMSRIYPYTAKYRYDNIGDGLHPHSNQHKIMGRLLANAIREKC